LFESKFINLESLHIDGNIKKTNLFEGVY
jgi:hypothetical protein